MEAAKAAWRKPELVVLVRARPEEAVLTVCKTGSGPFITGVSQTQRASCRTNAAGCNTNCTAISNS